MPTHPLAWTGRRRPHDVRAAHRLGGDPELGTQRLGPRLLAVRRFMLLPL